MFLNLIRALTCALGVLVVSCGGSNATGPTSPTGSLTPGTVVNTHVGVVNLPGGAKGTLQLRASNSLASLGPRGIPVWSRLLAWVEPTVAAQSSTATGLLATSNGDVVTLSGTFSGSTFNVSGGGYTIVATVASTSTGTSISGTATVPGGGTATITPPDPLPVTSPPPANPAGTYSGAFHVEITGSMVNRRVSDNSLELNCVYSFIVDGTLAVTIPGVLASGLVQAQLGSSWTEVERPVSCKLGDVQLSAIPPSVLSFTVSPGPGVADFEGPAGGLVFGHAGQSPNQNGQGTVTRSESYVGAVSGNTLVMSVTRSFRFANQFTSSTSGPIDSVMSHPPVTVVTTLTKQ